MQVAHTWTGVEFGWLIDAGRSWWFQVCWERVSSQGEGQMDNGGQAETKTVQIQEACPSKVRTF